MPFLAQLDLQDSFRVDGPYAEVREQLAGCRLDLRVHVASINVDGKRGTTKDPDRRRRELALLVENDPSLKCDLGKGGVPCVRESWQR